MKEYQDQHWCPFCKAETTHNVCDQEHERDMSYDSRRCIICGAHWMGLTGKYSKYVNGAREERSENHGRI